MAGNPAILKLEEMILRTEDELKKIAEVKKARTEEISTLTHNEEVYKFVIKSYRDAIEILKKAEETPKSIQ